MEEVAAASPAPVPVDAASTAAFLSRCARAPQRYFFPCNAKHRTPVACNFIFARQRRAPVAEPISVCVHECDWGAGGTGWRVWPCALLLACWLSMHEEEIGMRSCSVLELGCGHEGTFAVQY